MCGNTVIVGLRSYKCQQSSIISGRILLLFRCLSVFCDCFFGKCPSRIGVFRNHLFPVPTRQMLHLLYSPLSANVNSQRSIWISLQVLHLPFSFNESAEFRSSDLGCNTDLNLTWRKTFSMIYMSTFYTTGYISRSKKPHKTILIML